MRLPRFPLTLLLALCSTALLAQESLPEAEDEAALEAVEPLPAPPPPLAEAAPEAARKVNLQLSGNRHLDEEAIRKVIGDQLAEIATLGISPALADDAAFFLGVHYRKLGYSQADVAWVIGGSQSLRLTISEGPLTRLGTVTLQGNAQIPTEQLLPYFTGTAEQAPQSGEKVMPFNEGEVTSGAERVRGLYASLGYLDALVDEPEITLSPDRTRADVVLYIHEGIPYRFGELTFETKTAPGPDLLEELKPLLAKPYTSQGVIALDRKVNYYYRTRGYFRVKVSSEGYPERAVDGNVPVVFTIDAGEVHTFDGVTQKGLKRLRPSFLENRFSDLRGKPYTPTIVDERYRKLMGTGLFTNLRMRQKAIAGNEVQLNFKVEEAKARELGFVVGYGSLEGAILGARYLDRNLFGMGRPFSVSAEIAQNLLRGEILYTDPWFWNNDYNLRLRLYALNQDFKDYSKLESGALAHLSRKFGKHLEVSAFVLGRALEVRSGTMDHEELGPTSYFANSIGTSFTLDYRDSALNPNKGLVVNGSVDIAHGALGSSIGFFRSTGRVSYYLPLGKTLLAVGLRGGIIVPIGDERLPIDERFFNGGSRSVRSYVERSMGPMDSGGRSVGGETFTTLNIENVFPIWGNLKGAVFFDAGTVGRKLENGFGTSGFAVGAGLRYALPIGPIRVDYGFNPIQGEKKPFGALHISVGFAF